MTFLLQQTVIYTVPLILVALAGVFAERSGIINLALEGIMIIGAFVGAWFVRIMQEGGWSEDAAQWLLILALLVTAAAGALFSLLLSFSAVKMKADQTIGGTALNLLAPAIVLFLVNIVFQQNTLNLRYDAPSWFMLFQTDFGFERKAKLGLIGDLLLNKTYLTTYLGLLLYVVLAVILYKTRFGLRLRACGEHPQAADAAGGDVARVRFLAVMLSGAVSGIGGLCFAYSISANFSPSIYMGYGYLSIAAMIFGNWNILPTAAVCMFFGLAKSGGYQLCLRMGLPSNYSDLFMMLPYILTLSLLTDFYNKNHPPAAASEAYEKGKR